MTHAAGLYPEQSGALSGFLIPRPVMCQWRHVPPAYLQTYGVICSGKQTTTCACTTEHGRAQHALYLICLQVAAHRHSHHVPRESDLPWTLALQWRLQVFHLFTAKKTFCLCTRTKWFRKIGTRQYLHHYPKRQESLNGTLYCNPDNVVATCFLLHQLMAKTL